MWLSGKESTCQCRSHRRYKFDPWVRDLLEKKMATHSRIIAWEIPWIGSLVGSRAWGHKESDRTWTGIVLERCYFFTNESTNSVQSQLKSQEFFFFFFWFVWLGGWLVGLGWGQVSGIESDKPILKCLWRSKKTRIVKTRN